MRLREIGWGLALAGLPWSHLLFRPLDPWHGQALFWQASVLCLSAWAVSGRGHVQIVNKPLGFLLAYLSLWTLWLCWQSIRLQKAYLLPILPAACHLLLIVLAYHALSTTLTPAACAGMGRAIAWSTALLVGYGVLQLLNCDPFFKNLDPNIKTDALVGTLGNPSHFAAQLAVLSPWLWHQRGRGWQTLSVVAGALVLGCRSTGGVLALAAAGAVGAWVRWPHCRGHLLVGGAVACGLFVWGSSEALNDHGRWAAWKAFAPLFWQRPWFGSGPGFVMGLSGIFPEGHALYQWRHVHNEYYQMVLEWGLVGFGVFAWVVADGLGRLRQAVKTPLGTACAASLAALLVNSLVNFPLHLAGIGAYGLFAYVGLLVATEA